MRNFAFIICFVLLFCIDPVRSQTKDSTSKKGPVMELSFGNSLLFIPDSKLAAIRSQNSVVLPTSALLFFVEFRPKKLLRFPLFFNLPTESKQFLVDGQLVNEKANPTFGTGVEFRVFKVNISEKTQLDMEVGPLISCIINKNGNLNAVPVFAGRFRLMKGENFVMYVGGSFSLGIDAAGLLYGTGTFF